MKNCTECSYGPWDPSSDICDGCRNEPDTGWGGFTDNALGIHFDTEEEREKYLEEINENDE